jgi:predicted CxxxxCH...CXXCH cytochrome family protein
MTEGNGALHFASTFRGIGATLLSPYNADGNTFCTNLCHDDETSGTQYTSGKKFHGYSQTTISLEGNDSQLTTTIPGCLSTDGSPTGCHNVHNVVNNADLIAVQDSTGSDVSPSDCGVCHTFDDPPDGNFANRHLSEYYGNGHGYISTVQSCTSCHDPAKPHFNADGSNAGKRLAFAEDTVYSTFSDPPMSLRSACNSCHSSDKYKPHSAVSEGGDVNIGCLDCHDPHGKTVEDASGKNMFMLRRAAPKPGAANTIFYETAGAYYDSSTWASGDSTNFSNQLCDNQDCHNTGGGGPGALAAVMNVGTGSHSGGTADITDCVSCHKHEDNAGAMRATESCSTCHGDSVAGDTWPNDPSNVLAVRPDRAGAHAPHVAALGGNTACATCHPGGVHSGDQDTDPADVHQDGISSTFFQNMPYISGADTNAVYNSPVAEACDNVSCHGNNSTQAWYDTTTVACLACHQSASDGGSLGDGIPNAVNNEWGTDGHGSPDGGSFTSTYGGCDYCHESGADHFPPDAVNPYRLRFSATDNSLCLQCHATGDSGVTVELVNENGVANVETTHYGAKHQDGGTNNGGRFCWDCHDPHGVPTNILMVKDNLSKRSNTYGVPLATATIFSPFTSRSAVTDFVDISDPAQSTAGICQACHENDPGVGNYGDVKFWRYDGTEDRDEDGTDETPANGSRHNDDKVCLDCHQHQNGFAGVGDACNACHENPPATGAHLSHSFVETNDQSEDRSDCAICHTGADLYTYDWTADRANTTTPLNHSDATGRVSILGSTVGYNDADGSCSAACHLSSALDASWLDTGGVNCDACHYWAADAVSSSGSANSNHQSPATSLSSTHNAHFDAPVAANIVCADCHADPNNPAYYTTPMNHIDNYDAVADSDDVVINDKALAEPSEASLLSSALGNKTRTTPQGCDNTLCHNPSGGSYMATWGNTNASCTFCHDDEDNGGPGGLLRGSHDFHIDAWTGGQLCNPCHVDNTSIYGHMDRAVSLTVTLEANYTGDVSDYTPTTFGSCESGACHDTDTDPAWGTTPGTSDCADCHLSSAADVNSFSGTDSQATVINSAEWIGVGHGKAPTIAKICTDCHSSSIPHDFTGLLSGPNPYRLDTSGGPFTCSDFGVGCHEPGIMGPRTGIALTTMVTHSSAEMAAANYSTRYPWSFAPECVNCHDPHGDGSNLSMIQSDLWDKGVSATWVPVLPVDNTSLSFINDTTGLTSAQEGYADYTVASSVCQECHEGTPGTNTPKGFDDNNLSANFSGHPGYNVAQAGSGNPGDCSACHKHDSAFMPSGCSGCHGGGTTGTDASNYWPDDSNANEENDAGRHLIHVEQLAQAAYGETIGDLLNDGGTTADEKQKTLCEYCHAALTNDADHGSVSNLPAEVFSTTEGRMAKKIWDGANDPNAAYNGTPDFSCDTVACHNNKSTADAGYAWYNTTASACIMCHTDVTDGGSPQPTAITHTAHADSATFGRVIVCGDCHTGSTGAPDWAGNVKPIPDHMDGAFLVSGGNVSFTYSGYTYPTPKGTCGNNECHNDGQGGTPAVAYTWGNSYADCSICHGEPPLTGQHSVHVANTYVQGTPKCLSCHPAASASTHIDATVHDGGTFSVGYSTVDECAELC